MSISIHFISAVVRQDDIEAHFPGGLRHFLDLFPYAIAEAGLVAVHAMSGGDIGIFLDELIGQAPVLEHRHAVGDMFIGTLTACEGIVFEQAIDTDQWRVRLAQ